MKYYNNNGDNKYKKSRCSCDLSHTYIHSCIHPTNIRSEGMQRPIYNAVLFQDLYIHLFCAETAFKAGKCPDHRKSIFINRNAVNKEEPSVVLHNGHKRDREKRFRMALKRNKKKRNPEIYRQKGRKSQFTECSKEKEERVQCGRSIFDSFNGLFFP